MIGDLTGREALLVCAGLGPMLRLDIPMEYICPACDEIHLVCKVCVCWKIQCTGVGLWHLTDETFGSVEEFKQHFLEVHLS